MNHITAILAIIQFIGFFGPMLPMYGVLFLFADKSITCGKNIGLPTWLRIDGSVTIIYLVIGALLLVISNYRPSYLMNRTIASWTILYSLFTALSVGFGIDLVNRYQEQCHSIDIVPTYFVSAYLASRGFCVIVMMIFLFWDCRRIFTKPQESLLSSNYMVDDFYDTTYRDFSIQR